MTDQPNRNVVVQRSESTEGFEVSLFENDQLVANITFPDYESTQWARYSWYANTVAEKIKEMSFAHTTGDFSSASDVFDDEGDGA